MHELKKILINLIRDNPGALASEIVLLVDQSKFSLPDIRDTLWILIQDGIISWVGGELKITEYTPTTEQVRIFYIGTHPSLASSPHQKDRAAEFERWLNSVKAEAFTEGWDHAVETGDIQKRQGWTNAEASSLYHNPYETKQ